MSNLYNYQLSEVAFDFPHTEQPSIESLILKCQQLEILRSENETRKIFTLQTPYFPTDGEGIVTENELKNWLNNLGESTVFDNKLEEENWEKLLRSDAPENKILALTLLNTQLRPESKYFALWIALGSLSPDETVRETAKMLVLQYLTQAEWDLFESSTINSTVIKFVKQTQELPDFIDINYLQIWSEMLIKNSPFFTQKWLRLSNNRLERILDHPNLLKKLPEITQFNYRITNAESPTFLDFFQKNCPAIKYLHIYSDTPKHFSSNEFAALNSENVIVKNFHFPAVEEAMPKLSKVTNIEWIYPEKVNFSDKFFPKVTVLDVLGTSVETFDIEQIKLNLENLVFSFSEQNTLPPVTYECLNLKEIHPHDLTDFEFRPEVKNLKKLETICFGETTLKRFPTEIGLFSKLRFAWGEHFNITEIENFQNHAFKGPTDITLMNKEMTEFPYCLSIIQELKTLGLMSNKIAEINERILKFTKLERLTLGKNKLTEMPNSLMQLPKLRYLHLANNQIEKVPFEWVLFTNFRNLQLNLQDNPITDLPPIPSGLDLQNIAMNKGKITLRRNQIPQKRMADYHKVFGGKFFSIY